MLSSVQCPESLNYFVICSVTRKLAHYMGDVLEEHQVHIRLYFNFYLHHFPKQQALFMMTNSHIMTSES